MQKMLCRSYRGMKPSPLPNEINQDDEITLPPLLEAAKTGNEKKLRALLKRNVDRNAKESTYGNTALHEAALSGFSRCVQLLCVPNGKEGQVKVAKLDTCPVRYNLILDIQNDKGFTALHLAAQNGHNQSCRELLLAGADPDVQNNFGDTPLHTACRYGHAGIVRILISAACDSSKTNQNGDTALHITCAMGKRKLSRILLEINCDLNIRNSQNETPINIAIRKNHKEILNILNNPGKRLKKGEKKNSQSKPLKSQKEISWSPYGCHYYPDPHTFPMPNLETLPQESLLEGEQYFLDLAGRIRKGPICFGNFCYCDSLFDHVESQIRYDRNKLWKHANHKKKYSHNESLHPASQNTKHQSKSLHCVHCDKKCMEINHL